MGGLGRLMFRPNHTNLGYTCITTVKYITLDCLELSRGFYGIPDLASSDRSSRTLSGFWLQLHGYPILSPACP